MRAHLGNPIAILVFFALTPGAAHAQKTRSVPALRTMVEAPANVTVTGVGQSATISWTAAAGAATYRVLRSTDPNQPGQDITAPITATSLVDQKLNPGETVYYSVIAVASTGATASSAAVAYAPASKLVSISKPVGGGRMPAPPPAPVIPAGTSVTPASGLAGRTVRVGGTGFNAITAVRSGTVDLVWTKLSDTEIDVTLPGPTAGFYGTNPVPLSLIHGVPNVAPGTVQPAPTSLYPPKILVISNRWAECCEMIGILGQGFTAGGTTVKVGGVSAQVYGSTTGSVVFRVPILPLNDMGAKVVTVEHAGGIATAADQLTLVSGPTTITSISPNTFSMNQPVQLTVQGTNLFRLVGICFPGVNRIYGRNDVGSSHQTSLASNDQMTLTVTVHNPGGPLTGPIALAMPVTVPTGQRSYGTAGATCQPNATAVNVTIQ